MHHHHHACCAPTGRPAGCGGFAPWTGITVPIAYYYYVPCCPSCSQPHGLCRCPQRPVLQVPQEVVVGASAAGAGTECVIGGAADVEPILEYLPEAGGAAPEVTVEQAGTSATILFHETGITAGYHVVELGVAVPPGTRLRLSAKDCFARLRWCERIEY